MRLRPIATACVLAGITLLLYVFQLSAAPLSQAESTFNAQAQSIRGGHTPLFFHVRDDQWLQPLAVYANAGVRAVGGDDVSGRLAGAIAGALSVAIVCLITWEITGILWVSAVAALILMLTPAFWSFARLGTDAIVAAPLILLWLWNTLRFCKGDALRSLTVAGALLGVSVYAHATAPLTALFLWCLTLAVVRRRNLMRLFVATLVFGAAWLPAAAWFFRHAETYPDTFGRWFVFAAHLRNPLEGVRAFLNTGTLGNRASMYWGFWDPSWLFFNGADVAAPLSWFAAPLIAAGVFRCTRHAPRDTAAFLIGTALIGPLAGATFGVPHYMTDAPIVMPILAVLSALGVQQLIRLVTRRPLEDDVAAAAVDGWDDDGTSPRS